MEENKGSLKRSVGAGAIHCRKSAEAEAMRRSCAADERIPVVMQFLRFFAATAALSRGLLTVSRT